MSRRHSFTRGAAVTIRLDDGTVTKGQVWSEGESEGQVWVALDSGHYARVHIATGRADVVTAQLVPVQGGRVAA